MTRRGSILERAGEGVNPNGIFGKGSEAASLPQGEYSLSPAIPLLLKPLYIIRRLSIASNAESTQALAKEINQRPEQLGLNPCLADWHFGIDRGELVSADLVSVRIDEKGRGNGLAEELQTMPAIS
jgi:hypothetical protein